MKQTIKSKLEQARPQPGYEFRQAVEDALDRLPPADAARPGPRRPLMVMGAAAAILAVALPLSLWRLSAGRPDPPQKPLSESGARPVVTGIQSETGVAALSIPTVNTPDDAVPMPVVSAPDDAIPMPRVIEIQTDATADRAAEDAFFEQHFPGNVLADPGVAVDGMTLALRGLRLSDDKSNLLVGALLYGEGMSHRLVDDHEKLSSLYPNEIALDGTRLNNGGSNYPHTDLEMEESGSGTCSVFTVPLGNFVPKDATIPIRLVLRNYSASGESMPSVAVMANLLTGEARFPNDERQRQEWLDQSYTPIERTLRNIDPFPRHLDIAAPLGERELRMAGFAYDGVQGGFSVILNDPEPRDLTIKQLYAYGQSQLMSPLKPSQSMPVDGGYGYVFTLPLNPTPDPYGAKRRPGYYSFLVPLFQLGDDQQLLAISYFELDDTYYVQDASSDGEPDEILQSAFPEAYGVAYGYALRYDISAQGARWSLPDGLTIDEVMHNIGSIELNLIGMEPGSTAQLRLDGELLMPLPPEDYEGAPALRFFTDRVPGRLPDGSALSLTLYPPDGSQPIEFPGIRLQIEDAAAEVGGVPVESYPGTGIGQPYEQISASFRGDASPHFIGATVDVGQMRVTLAELAMPDALSAGVLVEGDLERLPPGALALERLRVDGAPVEYSHMGATPKYAGDAARAYLCYGFNEGADDALPEARDGQPHRIELDFTLNGQPFTLETSGTFTDIGFVPQQLSAQTAVNRGETAKEIQQIQLRLAELGYFDGVAEGDLGPLTIAAIEKFQDTAGLEATGNPDAHTLERLFAADAPSWPSQTTPEATPAAESSPDGN